MNCGVHETKKEVGVIYVTHLVLYLTELSENVFRGPAFGLFSLNPSNKGMLCPVGVGTAVGQDCDDLC